MKIMSIVRGDDQHVGRGRLSKSFYDNLFGEIVVLMEAGVSSPWRRQGDQTKSHNGCQMLDRAFKLVTWVKGFR